MTILEQALALCQATNANQDDLKSLVDKLKTLGFEHSWNHQLDGENIWEHPEVTEINKNVGVLNSYFCTLYYGSELVYIVGRIGNTAVYRCKLPAEEHKKCPNCGGAAYYGYLRQEERLVLKRGRKRRSRATVKVYGWLCSGNETDLEPDSCGWTE
jgi:anaerobic ribonucleoside-triphosphate reductase